jgi:glycosyltransferase involved in cell wall biosynthesis
MSVRRNPRVSIGLPVYNGKNFLEEAIKSILSQTFEDFELIISDNASTDQTEEICCTYKARDKRIKYYRNRENVGGARNLNRVFALSSGEYFKWAAHDDVCRPNFLLRCVEVLDRDPSVVLCHTEAASIDADGQLIKKWDAISELGSSIPQNRFRAALAIGEEIFFVWGLIRTNILSKTPLLGGFIGNDRALFSRLSLYGRFHQVPEVLFLQREHKMRSVHVYNWRKPHQAIIWYDPSKEGKMIFPTWKLFAEHVAGINQAPLSWRERISCYGEICRWLRCHKQRLLRDLIVAGEHVPGLGLSWLKRLDQTSNDIESVIPVGDVFILVDDETLETEIFGERRTIPFPEKDGLYWGPPPDDDTAILELERLRQSGANFIVFIWSTFWWLDHYTTLHQYLRSRFRCVLKNKRLIVFDLRPDMQPS